MNRIIAGLPEIRMKPAERLLLNDDMVMKQSHVDTLTVWSIM
jgi:hypothetical protein